MDCSYEGVIEANAAVRERLRPQNGAAAVGIVLGSGLGLLSESIEDLHRIPYSEIPNMPKTAVVGHDGALLSGTLGGCPVLCLSGRAHLYEGHHPAEVVFGVRLLASFSPLAVILTNAAGGIADVLHPGTLMLIEDHLNLTGQNPLTGANDDRLGPRFPDMSEVYSSELRTHALKVAESLELDLPLGVYAGLLGPSYETPAEVRMLRGLGASAVGMSTTLEAIALRHQEVPVLGLSCITNAAAGLSENTLNHEEVAAVALKSGKSFCALVQGICRRLSTQ